MKRKIILLIGCLILVSSFNLTAFASSATYPVIPTERPAVVVTDENGVITAYCFTGWYNTRADYDEIKNYDLYEYIGGAWEYKGLISSVKRLERAYPNYLYDNTKHFLTENLISFAEMIKFKDFNPFYDGLKGQITVSNVVGVLVVGASAAVCLVFMYWGIRKAVRALVKAFKKGHISL